MRTITIGGVTLTYFDKKVWKQERNLVRVKSSDPTITIVKLCYPNTTTTIATYTLNAEGEVTIDMSDFIRLHGDLTYPNTVSVIWGSGTSMGISYHIAGLINPARLFVPAFHVPCAFMTFVPPTYIGWRYMSTMPKIEVVAQADDNVAIWHTTGVSTEVLLANNTPTELTMPANGVYLEIRRRYGRNYIVVDGVQYNYNSAYTPSARELPCEWTDGEGNTWYTENRDRASVVYAQPDRTGTQNTIDDQGGWNLDTQLGTYYPQAYDCERTYAWVRWVSPTGAERVAVMEVTKRKLSPTDDVAFLTDDNSYNILRGRVDGFSLCLRQATAYDVWYYGSIATSSKVEVSLDGLEWSQVEVTTKGVTIPDGDAGKLGDIELAINWRKYDAVAM